MGGSGGAAYVGGDFVIFHPQKTTPQLPYPIINLDTNTNTNTAAIKNNTSTIPGLSGQPTVHVTFAGKEANFVLDTGADRNLIHPDTLNALHRYLSKQCCYSNKIRTIIFLMNI